MLPTLIWCRVGYTSATGYRHLPGGGPQGLRVGTDPWTGQYQLRSCPLKPGSGIMGDELSYCSDTMSDEQRSLFDMDMTPIRGSSLHRILYMYHAYAYSAKTRTPYLYSCWGLFYPGFSVIVSIH